MLNLHCTNWDDNGPLPNGWVEDSLFGIESPEEHQATIFTNSFLEYILESNNIPYRYVKDTPPGFIYFLDAWFRPASNFRTNVPFSKILTKDIVQSINNRGTLVLYEAEGYSTIFGRLVTELLKAGVNLNKIIMIGASKYKDPRVEIHYVNHLEECFYNKIIRNKSSFIESLKPTVHKTNYFTFLNGRCNSIHKQYMVKKIYESSYFTKCIFSLIRAEKYNLLPKNLLDKLPIEAAPYLHNKIETQADNNITNLFRSSYFGLIQTASIHIWRKHTLESRLPLDIYHSALAMRPYIISSNFIGVTDFLHTIGYKTFHPYIDESYDKEPDIRKRYTMILKQIDKLCSMSFTELDQLLLEMRPILLHNAKRVVSNDRITKPITDSLLKRSNFSLA
jgi:hypothetical protein